MSEGRTTFHQQLQSAEEKVVQLFALVAEDLSVATEALLSSDRDALTVISEREKTIDAVYREVEDLVNLQMARQEPVASDLRLLLAVLRIVPELERSHDLVVHIAEHATHSLGGELSPAAGVWCKRWATPPETCGTRRSPPGTGGKAGPPTRSPSGTKIWTDFTPPCWPNWRPGK